MLIGYVSDERYVAVPEVLLEFVSANPTGPLHVGHGRGAAFGEALSRILQASGFSVEPEYILLEFNLKCDFVCS